MNPISCVWSHVGSEQQQQSKCLDLFCICEWPDKHRKYLWFISSFADQTRPDIMTLTKANFRIIFFLAKCCRRMFMHLFSDTKTSPCFTISSSSALNCFQQALKCFNRNAAFILLTWRIWRIIEQCIFL